MNKNFWIDVILFISGMICIVTGIILDFHLISGGREIFHTLRRIHIYSGYVMAIGIILHVFLHVNWIKTAVKNIFFKKS